MNLTETELVELQRRASARTGRADSARHARLILLLAEGLTGAQVRASSIAATATSIAGANALSPIAWRACSPATPGENATR